MKQTNMLMPQKAELFLYSIIAFLLSVLVNLDFYMHDLGLIDHMTGQTVIEVFDNYIDSFVSIFDGTTIAPASAVFIFWSLIGLLTMSILHQMHQVYIELQENIEVATKFYHPKHYSTLRFWRSVIARSLENGLFYVFTVVSGLLVFKFFVPLASNALTDLYLQTGIVEILIYAGSFAALWGAVTIFGIVLRILVGSKRFL